MIATQMLRRQHRHIEQEFALLESLDGDCESEFAAVVVEVIAHLAAEASVLYSATERALGQPLAHRREDNERLREAVFHAAGASVHAKSFPRLLFNLAEAFKAHSQIEERAVLSLEGVMTDRQLEALGTRVAAFHSAVAAAMREGRPCDAGRMDGAVIQ